MVYQRQKINIFSNRTFATGTQYLFYEPQFGVEMSADFYESTLLSPVSSYMLYRYITFRFIQTSLYSVLIVLNLKLLIQFTLYPLPSMLYALRFYSLSFPSTCYSLHSLQYNLPSKLYQLLSLLCALRSILYSLTLNILLSPLCNLRCAMYPLSSTSL